MKNIILLVLILTLKTSLYSQSDNISDCLQLIKLTESTYIHSCDNNNGLVFISNQEAVIISTPDSDIETQNLINWVKDEQESKIIAYVVDRWHPDAMGGIDVVHQNGIQTFSYKETRKIAKRKGLPIPIVGFTDRLELTVGNKKVVLHYLGEAHTTDGIVAWIPEEKILFGGNEIRNDNGWIGNIADANLSEWSNTVRRVKENYGDAKFVIPGHGNFGGSELIDYTINLYSFSKNVKYSKSNSLDFLIFEEIDDFHFATMNREARSDGIIYTNSKVSFRKKNKVTEILADSIVYNPEKKSLYVPSGYIELKYKDRTESFCFSGLYANLREDEVKMTLVIKEVK